MQDKMLFIFILSFKHLFFKGEEPFKIYSCNLF